MTELSVPKNPLLPGGLRADHDCFGCGDNNPIGLHLRFEVTADGVHCVFVPKSEYQGFETIVHGGIISTVLDEAMAWATAHAGYWAVTAELNVRFRRPLQVGELTTVTARVSGRRGRTIRTEAELTRVDDVALIATASATFMQVSESVESTWRARYLNESRMPEGELTEVPQVAGNWAQGQLHLAGSCDDVGDATPDSN